ncbi:hypothetical protein TNCV_4736811 [Trichonephila clavipes]|nr:hypothetical protein TNCV_4736811 [Trichonephila clavipes]
MELNRATLIFTHSLATRIEREKFRGQNFNMFSFNLYATNFSRQKREQFLDYLVTGDEKWIVYKLVEKVSLQSVDTTIHIQNWRATEDYVVLLLRQQEYSTLRVAEKEKETAFLVRNLMP